MYFVLVSALHLIMYFLQMDSVLNTSGRLDHGEVHLAKSGVSAQMD